MTVTDTPSPTVAELGVGRPVLVLGAAPASPGLAALAARFRVFALVADGPAAASWIAEQGFETLGIVGVGDAASAALDLVRKLGEAADALVLVSPTAAPPNGEERLATPVCVLVGDRDPAAAPIADWRRAHASTVVVSDADADILADRPDAFASAAGDFLDRKARFAFADSVALTR